MKNITKFLTTAATVSYELASNYVYNNIDKKQQEKIIDYGTLKKRDDLVVTKRLIKTMKNINVY